MQGGASIGSCASSCYMVFGAGLDAICRAFIVLLYTHTRGWLGGEKKNRVVDVTLSFPAQTNPGHASYLPHSLSHSYTILNHYKLPSLSLSWLSLGMNAGCRCSLGLGVVEDISHHWGDGRNVFGQKVDRQLDPMHLPQILLSPSCSWIGYHPSLVALCPWFFEVALLLLLAYMVIWHDANCTCPEPLWVLP